MTQPTPRSWDDLPDARDGLDAVIAAIGNRPAVFCDYDGTLTEIVDDPAQARLTAATRSVLETLAACCSLGVVSGRSLEQVRRLVGIPGVIHVGSHGLEIDGSTGEYLPGEAEKTQQMLQLVDSWLAATLSGLAGVFLERKPFSIAVHTRNAQSEQARERAQEAARQAVDRAGGLLVLQHGKEVVELRPAFDWNKGSAVAYLVDQLQCSGILYLGDDRTDEDAFVWVQSAGGVAVSVGRSPGTSAGYRLDGPDEVTAFLGRLSTYICEDG